MNAALSGLLVLVASCGGGDDAPPDGFERVFADDFSGGLARWTETTGCVIDSSSGRPAPAATGGCKMRVSSPTSFAGQRAIATIDFAAGSRNASAGLHLFVSQAETTSFGDPVIGLGVSDFGDVPVLVVMCPATTVSIDAPASGFHHADLRVEDGGISVAIDGVEVCSGAGLQTLTGDYRIVLSLEPDLAGPIAVDNVKLYRGL